MTDTLRDRIAAAIQQCHDDAEGGATATELADAVIAELGLTKIEMLARSWRANYDAIPANDPRNPTDADIAYDDAGFQILHALGLEAND